MTCSRRIVLGISGCISAYKACQIVRNLQTAGCDVRVVMTKNATEFVGPTTFAALTHHPVGLDTFGDLSNPIPHISLADDADLFLIAPCSADVMAKLAHGIADDLLTSTALACTCPVAIAPSMNVHMYENAATQANLSLLQERGVLVIDGEEGYLACGYTGKGRLADPGVVSKAVLDELEVRDADLAGKTVLITAGPTQEPIDAVRCITNYSSGKTGYALAQAAKDRGAEVVLVSGPVALQAPQGVQVFSVKTAAEMYEAVQERFDSADIAIFAAAVADVRPANPVEGKLKKGIDDAKLESIDLIRNPDILASMAAQKTHQYVVGFAAETNDVCDNGRKKLDAKAADMIVANLVGEGKAFGTDDNEVWIITADETDHLPSMNKSALADGILDRIASELG